MNAPLDLSALEIFRAVAAERSVTRAAQRLARVQSNVTTRLKQLEDELGTTLFLREGRQMTLTAEGQRLLAYTEQLLALSEEARQAMHPQQPAGRLRIGAMESTAASRLPQPFAEYHRSWPEVELELTTGTTCALLDAVQARTLDCALVANPAAMTDPPAEDDLLTAGLEQIVVFTETLLLVVPADHPEVRSPQDLQSRTLAGFARGCAYRKIAENWLAAHPLPDQRQLKVLEVGSYHAILACVATGSCFAVIPQSVLELQRAGLPIKTTPLLDVDTLLVCRSGYRTPAFEAFARVLQGRASHA